MPMSRTAVAVILISAILISDAAPIAVSRASTPAEIEPPLRPLWSRGAERFQRQWLIAGPVSAQALAKIDVPSLSPAVGQPVSDDGVRWWAHASWGDVIDPGTMVGPTATADEARYVFAFATVPRKHAGPAELSLGAEGAVKIWVNAKAAHESAGAVFVPDRERLPVQLESGDNRILVRFLLNNSGSTRFALRVVESGAVLPRFEEITPHIVDGSGTLTLRTHIYEEPAAPPVNVAVIAPGGKVLSRATAARGETVQFDSGTWRDGPYELQATTVDARGRRFVSHVPWYKGDAIAAARRLMTDARAASDGPTGATLRMLAEIVTADVGANFGLARPDSWQKLHPALMEYEELRPDSSGRALVRAGGFVRFAYRDDSDGSMQFCRAYLPLEYTPSQRWPMVISLHGYNPGNPRYHAWWSSELRHSAIADNHDVIAIEPHGRGNAQYFGIGENDVLHCIDEARKRFSVDENRVYLTGGSMGGHGTWRLASRHPQLFAAAAPVFGGWDLRVTMPGETNAIPQPRNALEFFMFERASSFAGAEGLLNVPLLVLHGDSDASVSVEGSRHAVRMLQRWGYNVRYEEMPGWGHEDLLERERVVDWLLTHRRDEAPRRVRLRSLDLEGAQAHWISARAIEEPVRLIRVDAEIMRPGIIRLDTENVAELRLAPPAKLRGPGDTLNVVWNGVARVAKLEHDGAMLSTATTKRSALRKQPGLEGPISDIVSTPFAVVVGTTAKDPAMRKYCQEKAEALRTLWEHWQHESPRIIKDTQLTRADEMKYSLILIGGADANAVTRRLAGRLPVKVAADAVTVDGRRWPASDAVLEMVYPSPVAPDRYVMLVASTSPAGMYFWRPVVIHPALGFALVGWDWRLRDGRRRPASEPITADDGAIAAGVFDSSWRADERWTTAGDAKRRASWKLRRPPAPDYRASTDLLEAAVGSYELFPGFALSVANVEGELIVRVPGQPELRMIPESELVFAHPLTGDVIEFVRDAQGKVSAIELEDLGRTFLAPRVAAVK